MVSLAAALWGCGGGQETRESAGPERSASALRASAAPSAGTAATNVSTQALNLDDIDRGTFCYSETLNFSANISDIKAGFQASQWLQTIQAMYQRRWPSGRALATAQAQDQYFKQFVDTSSFNKLAESMMVAIHEETHMWDLAGSRTEWNNYTASWISDELQFLQLKLYDSQGGFPRKQILPLIQDNASASTDEVYLRNAQQGEYHLQGVTAELNASLMGLPAAAAVAEYIDGIGASNSRDLALTNMSYLQLYLRVAKSNHAAYYAKLKSDAQLRKWALVQFLRMAYHLQLSEPYAAKLGSSNVPRLFQRVYAPENLAILEDFTGYRLPSAPGDACMGGGATQAPSISSQPADVTVALGQGASFSVQASGSNLNYQWRKDGADLPNSANGSSYSIAAVRAEDAGRYSVRVSNGAGSVLSAEAQLRIAQAAVEVRITPSSANLAPGGTLSFSASVSGSSDTRVSWSLPQSNSGSISSSGLYTAPAQAGTYRVRATSLASPSVYAEASVSVSVQQQAPSISTQPQPQTVAVGSSASFCVDATGSSPLSYQWLRNGSAVSGATARCVTTPAATTADNGALYSVRVSNPVGSVTSNSARLTVQGSSSGVTVTGTLTAGAYRTYPSAAPGYHQSTLGGSLTAQLSGPSGSNFNLYLYRWNGYSWAVVAAAQGPGSTESLSYTASPGYYYLELRSASGSGAFTLNYQLPR